MALDLTILKRSPQGCNVFKILKGNYFQPKIQYQAKYQVAWGWKKAIFRLQSQVHFSFPAFFLKNILFDVLHQNRKVNQERRRLRHRRHNRNHRMMVKENTCVITVCQVKMVIGLGRTGDRHIDGCQCHAFCHYTMFYLKIYWSFTINKDMSMRPHKLGIESRKSQKKFKR